MDPPYYYVPSDATGSALSAAFIELRFARGAGLFSSLDQDSTAAPAMQGYATQDQPSGDYSITSWARNNEHIARRDAISERHIELFPSIYRTTVDVSTTNDTRNPGDEFDPFERAAQVGNQHPTDLNELVPELPSEYPTADNDTSPNSPHLHPPGSTIPMSNRNYDPFGSAPIGMNYWDDSDANAREKRQIPCIRHIIKINEDRHDRDIVHGTSIPSTFLVCELALDPPYAYAKCFLYNFPLRFMLVPIELFNGYPRQLLGTTWSACIQKIRCHADYRVIEVARVHFGTKPQFIADVIKSGSRIVPTRIMKFDCRAYYGFYSEVIQIYVGLELINEDGDYKLIHPLFGLVEFNGRVMTQYPLVAGLSGNGWIEPKPGERSLHGKSPDDTPWLLVEPLVVHTKPETPVEDTAKAAREEFDKRFKKRFDRKQKKRLAKEMQGTGCRAKTGGSLLQCSKLIFLIRGTTKTRIFDDAMMECVTPLFDGPTSEGERLGQLADIVIDCLKEDSLFRQIEEKEPDNLEYLRDILKVTIDHRKDQSFNIPPRVSNLVWPCVNEEC